MEKELKSHIKYIKLFFLFLIFALIIQLFRLQVVEYDKWTLRSEIKNTLRSTYQATRGSVYFADGSPLAVSELAYGIYVIPQAFGLEQVKKQNITKEKFAKDFANLTKLDERVILENLNSNSSYRSIAKKITPEMLDQLKEKYPLALGVWDYEQQFRRVYPNKTLGAKIIGFVRTDDQNNEIGQYGIEQNFDGFLRGSEGIFEGTKDNQNQVIVNKDFESISSKNGVDLTLTVDRTIQSIVEQKLFYWFDKLKAKQITGVILEPNTGRVIAMADFPTFDPNLYWEGEYVDCSVEYYSVLNEKCNKPVIPDVAATPTIADETKIIYPDGYEDQLSKLQDEQKKLDEEKKKLEESLKDPNALTAEETVKVQKYEPAVRPIFRKKNLSASDVYRNSSSSILYEPGSVVKVLTLSIAYNYNTIPRDFNFQLGAHAGCEQVVDVRLCTADKLPKSSLTVEEMLRKSDNIGALRIAKTVPKKDFAESMQRFGLGKVSNIELEDESVFSMKDPSEWTAVDEATGAYGQGSVAFTPLQLTAAWNSLASDGAYYKPTIVKEMNDNGQKKVFEPTFIQQTVTKEAAHDALVVSSLSVERAGGNASTFHQKYPYAGKTGTANIPKTDGVGYLTDVYNNSYIGVAPLDNPKFTMLVWVREPTRTSNGGSSTAVNPAQAVWLDIASDLMIRFNVAPK